MRVRSRRIETGLAPAKRPSQLVQESDAKIASMPMILTALVDVRSAAPLDGRSIPSPIRSSCRASTSSGSTSIDRLWAAPRWIISIENLAIYGVLSLIFSHGRSASCWRR
jgi:glucose/mannose transport system permease protein